MSPYSREQHHHTAVVAAPVSTVSPPVIEEFGGGNGKKDDEATAAAGAPLPPPYHGRHKRSESAGKPAAGYTNGFSLLRRLLRWWLARFGQKPLVKKGTFFFPKYIIRL